MPLTKGFKSLRKSVKKTYLGKHVPPEYRKDYGFKYDLDEIDQLALVIAKSRGIQKHQPRKK